MIAGYRVYYLKPGEPEHFAGQIAEIPLTLKSMIIPPELKDSCVDLIAKNGNTVLQESVMEVWCGLHGITLGQD